MPSPLARVSHAFARATRGFRFPSYGGGAAGGFGGSFFGQLWGTLPGSQVNYARMVGDPAASGVVSIGLNWIADQFPEPEMGVVRKSRRGEEVVQPNHPLTRLLQRPNPYYTYKNLWAATVASRAISGDAFWIKFRGMGGAGAPQQLWFVPWWMMRPRWSADGNSFLDGYDYLVDGQVYELAPEDVVHFRSGIDPLTRRGVSRLYPVLRSVAALNEVEAYNAALMRNMGIPGVIISPKGDRPYVTQTQSSDFSRFWREMTTGDKRGLPVIPTVPVDVAKLGLTPEEMALEKIVQLPLQMVCAALRLRPEVLGLGAGPKGFDNGGQHSEARRAAYEDCIIPLQSELAEDLNLQLLPDFDRGPGECVRWDYTRVRCMSEDQDDRFKRYGDAWQRGGLTLDEYRAALGYPSDRTFGGRYYWQVQAASRPEPAEEQPAEQPQPSPAPADDDEDEDE